MNKKHVVILTEHERSTLLGCVTAGSGRARGLTHARILLKADQGPGGPRWTDQAIADALDVRRSTSERVRRRFAEAGMDAAVSRCPSCRAYRRKLDGRR